MKFKRKIFQRHPFLSFLLNLLLLSGILFFAVKFYLVAKTDVLRTDGAPIARTVFAEGLVQKLYLPEQRQTSDSKNKSSENWITIHENSTFFDEEVIKTGMNSEIQFSFGNLEQPQKTKQVYLLENSSAKLRKTGSSFFLEYKNGTIEVSGDSASSNFTIIAADKKIFLAENTKVTITRENDFFTQIILTVISGSAELYQCNIENPYEKAQFVLPSNKLVAGESLVLKKLPLRQ